MESDGDRSPRRASALALGVLLAVALAHGSSLWLPFLCDDWFLVHEARLPRSWLQELGIGWAAFQQWIRPLTLVTFRAQMALHGPEPVAFHAFNLLVHAAAAWALGWLVLEWSASLCAAFVAALAFAVHPLTVEATAWVAARSDLLCGMFSALALAALLRFVRNGGRALAAAAIACGFCAVMSKESGLSLVLLAPLVPRGADAAARARWRSGVLVAGAFGVAYAVARVAFFGGVGGYQADGATLHWNGALDPAVARIVSVARALAVPVRRESFPEGLGALRWLPLALVAAGALRASMRAPRGTARTALRLLAAFAAAYLPLATWWAFEEGTRGQRSLYLPIAVVCVAAALALEALSERAVLRAAAAVLACGVLGWASADAHRQWRAGGAQSERVLEGLAQRMAARADNPVWLTVDVPDTLGPVFVFRNGLTEAAWLRFGRMCNVYQLPVDKQFCLTKPREARDRYLHVTFSVRPERPIVCLRWDADASDWREL